MSGPEVKVTQADRSAAAKIVGWTVLGEAEKAVQIIARHRTTATAEADALLAMAVEALEVFAEMANHMDDTEARRDAVYCSGSPGLKCEVKKSDYHRARTALAAIRAKTGEHGA